MYSVRPGLWMRCDRIVWRSASRYDEGIMPSPGYAHSLARAFQEPLRSLSEAARSCLGGIQPLGSPQDCQHADMLQDTILCVLDVVILGWLFACPNDVKLAGLYI